MIKLQLRMVFAGFVHASSLAVQGSMHGPDVGELLHMFAVEDGDIADRSAYVPLPDRMERLRKAVANMPVADAVAA